MTTYRTWAGRPARPARSLPWSPRAVAAVGLVGAAVVFGAGTVASKGAMDHVPPLTLAWARFGLAALALAWLCRRAGRRPELSRRSALLGALGIALVYACQNLGLLSIGAANSTVIVEGTIPVATAAFAARLLGERVGGRRLAGLAVAVAGVGAIAFLDAGGALSAPGVLLSVAAAVSYAAATVVGKRAFREGVSLPLLAGSTAWAVLFLTPPAAAETAVVGVGPVTPRDALLVLFLGLAGSGAAQVLWAHGLARMDASEVAAFGMLVPVTGTATAAVVLAEPVGPAQVGGALLVGLGLLLTLGKSLALPRIGRTRFRSAAKLDGRPRSWRRDAASSAGWFVPRGAASFAARASPGRPAEWSPATESRRVVP